MKSDGMVVTDQGRRRYASGEAPHRSDPVNMERDAAFPSDPTQFSHGLHGTNLAVGRHDGNQDRITPDCAAQIIRIDPAVSIHWEIGDPDPALFQVPARIDDGNVLDCRRDDVPPSLRGPENDPLDRQIVGLGGSRREDHPPGRSSDQPGKLGPRCLQGLSSRAPQRVQCRGVPYPALKERTHDRHNTGVHRGKAPVVQVGASRRSRDRSARSTLIS